MGGEITGLTCAYRRASGGRLRGNLADGRTGLFVRGGGFRLRLRPTRVLHPESHAGVDSGRCTRRRHADPREERGPILPGQIDQLSSDPDRGTEIFRTATDG